MSEWLNEKKEDEIHTLPYCVKVSVTLRTSRETDVAFLEDKWSVLYPVQREQAQIKPYIHN